MTDPVSVVGAIGDQSRTWSPTLAFPGEAAGSEDPTTLVYGWSMDPLAHPDRYLEPLARRLAAVHSTP
ncbi:hypothetical protein JBE27_33755, partial [Streptomyces albiflaviniger]|nr:hypothetical protein [Streptomyces albiflaviniger]